MKRPGLSAATEAAAAVTVATAQREVQPAVTDSHMTVVSQCVSEIWICSASTQALTVPTDMTAELQQMFQLTDFNALSDRRRLHIPC